MLLEFQDITDSENIKPQIKNLFMEERLCGETSSIPITLIGAGSKIKHEPVPCFRDMSKRQQVTIQ
jgi:hypothetical protein